MITIHNLIKRYTNIEVLNIPLLEIPTGESFGLVGNNGAGKTTMFSLVLDLIKASEGQVLSNNIDVCQNGSWKQYTGSYLDESYLIDFLIPDEYFQFVGKLYHLSEGDVRNFLEGFSDFFNDEVLGKKKYIRDLSKGNQKKVGIAAALMGKPELLVLDEPFANLDPSSQIKLKTLLNHIRKEQELTMLISSHDLNHVTEVCERIVVLDKGRIIKDIRTSENTLKELEAHFTA